MNGFVVAKRINNNTLNDFGFLLDDKGNPMVFTTIEKAQEFLKVNGYTDEEISEGIRFFTCEEKE